MLTQHTYCNHTFAKKYSPISYLQYPGPLVTCPFVFVPRVSLMMKFESVEIINEARVHPHSQTPHTHTHRLRERFGKLIVTPRPSGWWWFCVYALLMTSLCECCVCNHTEHSESPSYMRDDGRRCNICGWRTNMDMAEILPINELDISYVPNTCRHIHITPDTICVCVNICKTVYTEWELDCKRPTWWIIETVNLTRFPLIRTIAQTNVQTQTDSLYIYTHTGF